MTDITARRYATTVYVAGLSVTYQNAKRRITKMTPKKIVHETLIFLTSNIFAKFQWDYPQRGRQIQIF